MTNDLWAINRYIRELRCGPASAHEAPDYRTEVTPLGGAATAGAASRQGQ